MAPLPAPKGRKLAPIKNIKVDRWDEDGNFTVTVKVSKTPVLSASRKCYMYAFEHGETEIAVPIGGVDRKVRLTFMLYVKIPATERRQVLAAEAREMTQRGDPQLY